MRRCWWACALLGAAGFAVNCGGGSSGGTIHVVATTVQIGALADEVAGGLVNVETLMGPGVDPHDFEPSPTQIRDVGDAGVILRNGLGLDDFLDAEISGSGAQRVVTVTDGIALRRSADPAEGEYDPHVWHNPENDKIMVANIADALAAAFPDHAEAFRANAAAYEARLDEVDAQIRALIDSIPPQNRKLVTDHDAFGYFIDRYGLTLVGTVIPGLSTQAEASAREIADLEDTIRTEGVKAVFSEGSVDPTVARQVAADTGVTIVDDLYGDSLGPPGSDAATVDGMLLFNARRIAEALR